MFTFWDSASATESLALPVLPLFQIRTYETHCQKSSLLGNYRLYCCSLDSRDLHYKIATLKKRSKKKGKKGADKSHGSMKVWQRQQLHKAPGVASGSSDNSCPLAFASLWGSCNSAYELVRDRGEDGRQSHREETSHIPPQKQLKWVQP